MKKSNSALKLNFNNINDNILRKINEKEREKEINKINQNENDNSNILPKHKTFLSNILELIKIAQNEYLSQISFNLKTNGTNANNNINKIIIKMLSNLKNDLIMILKDNTESKAKMQNTMNNNKSVLVKSIFDFERENINNLKYTNERKIKKNKNINNNNDIDYKYNIELPHLKLLNFRIENQITYIDIMIKLKNDSLYHLKNERNRFDDEEYYIFCDNQNDISDASKYLHDELIDIRNSFKSTVKQKDIQNRNLSLLKIQVASMKDDIDLLGKKSSNDYVNTSDIINEESRENYTKTNICTNENYINPKNDIEDNEFKFMKKNLVRINNVS